MKIIEAMKRIKANKAKIADLQKKIADNSAHLNIETPVYPDAAERILSWAKSCEDLGRDNVRMLTAIARTNLDTQVSIVIGDATITKSIAEWVWRRREYAKLDFDTWGRMTDRGLQEGRGKSSTGIDVEIKIMRKYDPITRDARLEVYRSEPHEIDAALEVVNAVTDLIE